MTLYCEWMWNVPILLSLSLSLPLQGECVAVVVTEHGRPPPRWHLHLLPVALVVGRPRAVVRHMVRRRLRWAGGGGRGRRVLGRRTSSLLRKHREYTNLNIKFNLSDNIYWKLVLRNINIKTKTDSVQTTDKLSMDYLLCTTFLLRLGTTTSEKWVEKIQKYSSFSTYQIIATVTLNTKILKSAIFAKFWKNIDTEIDFCSAQ